MKKIICVISVILIFFAFGIGWMQIIFRQKGIYSQACDYVLSNETVSDACGGIRHISPIATGSWHYSYHNRIENEVASIYLDCITDAGLARIGISMERDGEKWVVLSHEFVYLRNKK